MTRMGREKENGVEKKMGSSTYFTIFEIQKMVK